MEISGNMQSLVSFSASESSGKSEGVNVQVRMLSESLEMQGEMVEEILSSIGNSLDVYA